jgi:exopolysaccharide/PEP-CTERM locus tyrosine autokinase
MVKISAALDKAGYGEGLNGVKETSLQMPIEAQQSLTQSIPLPIVGQCKIQEKFTGKWDERLFKSINEDIHTTEVFKALRSKILHPWEKGTTPQTIMVTSAIPKEGKTFVAANLGISLAQAMDKHVLLVDCDLRKPSLATMFGLEYKGGLVNFLRDDTELSSLIMKTSMSKLSILAGGKPPVNPAELLGSSRMQSLVKELSQRYEDRIIIFDTPPMLVAAETAVLAGYVDAILVVVRHGTSGKAQIKKMIDTIGPEKILGVVFNANTVNYMEKNILKGYGYYTHD